MPDIVVLYAGANDQTQGETASEVYADLVEAVQAIQAAKPDVRILVSNHHPPRNNPNRDAQIALLNPVIPELQKLSTATSPVVTVDIFTGYPSSALDNGSHPGPDGQEHIGQEFFELAHEQLEAVVDVFWECSDLVIDVEQPTSSELGRLVDTAWFHYEIEVPA